MESKQAGKAQAPQTSHQPDLLQTVRSLDQTGPGDNGETLDTLYRALVASSARPTPFHAAEQSTLRWLLKTMNNPKATGTAELVQRSPLTWRIFELLFQRIPLFSLAKALADRRFVAVLRQALDHLSKTTANAGAAAAGAEPEGVGLGKRKRQPGIAAEGEPTSALWTADALFGALGRLVKRVQNVNLQGSHAKIGGEHVKSLFCVPAPDALKIITPLMNLCRDNIRSSFAESAGNATTTESWVTTTCAIWALHLQSQQDPQDVAACLTRPVLEIVRHCFLANHEAYDSWGSALMAFFRTNLVMPSRSEFLNHKMTGIIDLAASVTRRHADEAGPALYRECLRAYQRLKHPQSKDDEWMRSVFRAVEDTVWKFGGSLEQRVSAMGTIVAHSKANANVLDTKDLQDVFDKYALSDGATHWDVLRDVAELDPTVFFVGRGERLLEKVVERLSAYEHGKRQGADEAVVGVVAMIIRGFSTARNMQAFLKLWFEAISKAKLGANGYGGNVWFDDEIRGCVIGRPGGSPGGSPGGLEQHLSPQQIIAFLEWVQDQREPQVAGRLVVLSAIADGISSEAFVDAVGTRLYDLVASHVPCKDNMLAAYGWRAIARTVSWHTALETVAIWTAVRDKLCEILESRATPLASPVRYEAFKCACHLWASMHPDTEQGSEVSVKVISLLDEVVRSTAVGNGLEGLELFRPGTQDCSIIGHGPHGSNCSAINDVSGQSNEGARYLGWAIFGPAKVVDMLPRAPKQLPEALRKAFATDASALALQRALPMNAALVEAPFVGPFIDEIWSLCLRSDGCITMGEILMALQRFPADAFLREQREKIMQDFMTRWLRSDQGPQSLRGNWRVSLGLMAKLMTRPTFYPSMKFADLVAVADQVGEYIVQMNHQTDGLPDGLPGDDGLPGGDVGKSNGKEDTDGVPELFLAAAGNTIRQVATHLDDKRVEYFADAAKFVAGGFSKKKAGTRFLRLHLLNALVTSIPDNALARLPKHTRDDLQLDNVARAMARAIEIYSRDLAEKVREGLVEGLGEGLREGHASPDTATPLFAAIEAAACAQGNLAAHIQPKRYPAGELENWADGAIRRGALAGWKVKGFLIANFPKSLRDTRPTRFGHGEREGEASVLTPGRKWRSYIKGCLDAVLAGYDREAHFKYACDLLGDVDTARGGEGRRRQLVALQHAIHKLVQLKEDAPAAKKTVVGFTSLLGELASRLGKNTHPTELAKVLDLVHVVLDKKPGAMSQWSIETTLAAITTLCTAHASRPRQAYDRVCKVVEVLIRKNRLRLEGHYHLITTTLAALLHALFLGDPAKREAHARAFARLVTMLCEPSAGSMARFGQGQQHHQAPMLDSAKDAAKRSAGMYMYTVLISFVKILLELDVPKEVMDALEPAWTAVFDCMPPDTRKILNDSLDDGGRAILRDLLWKRYTMFGKWGGV